MITDTGKAPLQMTAPQRFHRKITVTARGAAMNYQEAHLPIVLIKTACSHSINPGRNLSRAHLPKQLPG